MTRLPGLDLDLFRINLGANVFGWTADQDTSFAILDAYVADGGNFIDTADVYPAWVDGVGGASERTIGAWLAARGGRDAVAIATKVGKKPGLEGLSADNVAAALAGSRERLGVDRIDLYYAHADDPARPIEEIAETFAALVADGSVAALGASNFGAERLRAWVTYARDHGLAAPVAVQPHWNLVERDYERELAPTVTELGLAVFPYYGLASGFLTGKYRSEADAAGTARGAGVAKHLTPAGFAVIDALVAVADAHGAAPATVALAWLLAKGASAPIASVSRPEQLPANLAAASLELTPAEVAQLDAASAGSAA